MAVSRETGSFPPLSSVEAIRRQPMSERRRRVVVEARRTAIVGTEDQVAESVEELIDTTGADEVISSASTFDTAALYDSDARLARLFGLG